MRSFSLASGFAVLSLAATLLAPQQARADGPVSGKDKGIIGGALLGAEVVTMPMGIAGLKPWWPYAVFGAVGAAGGAVGGWAVERTSAPAEAEIAMLAGGLALIIPTLVVSLNATTRKEYADEPTGEPNKAVAPPGQAPSDGTSITVTKSSKREVPHRHVAFVDFSGGEMQLGAPAVSVKPIYTPEEVSKYGVQQGTEVNIPVFSSSF